MTILERNSNLSQRVVQKLGYDIVSGGYRYRDFPTEADLCDLYGVSRSAIREAVKMLTAKGLVSSKPKQGIIILAEEHWNIFDPDLLRWALESSPSMSVLKEFLQMRLAIEPEASALAARLGDRSRISAIEAALKTMEDSEENSIEHLEADISFHTSILYASKNRFYIRMRNFISTALRVSISYTNPIKNSHQGVYEDHARVFNAIKSGNPERARQQMRLIIDEALDFIESELKRESNS